MNRKDKIELLRLIKEGKFNPDWLNIQYIVEQPDGSLTCNGVPYFYDPESEPSHEANHDKIIKKYVEFDLSGVSFETLKKWSEIKKIKNHE